MTLHIMIAEVCSCFSKVTTDYANQCIISENYANYFWSVQAEFSVFCTVFYFYDNCICSAIAAVATGILLIKKMMMLMTMMMTFVQTTLRQLLRHQLLV